MGWRSVVVTRPARLSVKNRGLLVEQEGDTARVPLEDISVLLLDHGGIELNAALLSALADAGIATITVGPTHHPNGALLPFLPHSRALKVMRAQLSLSLPEKKRLWQALVQRKVSNQGATLEREGRRKESATLFRLAATIRSGDPDNVEATAAVLYFRTLFGSDFRRSQERFYNAALNYGYAIIRAAIARSLVTYGFLPAFGLFHHSEQNSFNLADDLIEPFRPLLDAHVVARYGEEPERELAPEDKGYLISILHDDVSLTSHTEAGGSCTLLAAIESMVAGLSSVALKGASHERLPLPLLAKGRETDSEEA